jgi:hypothetical protein
MREYIVKGILLYFSNGTIKRIKFQAKTTDIEKLREVIKNRYNAQVVRFRYEEN